MSTEYSRSVLRVVVAQICQTIGWHSINSIPLEFMVDLMQEYLLRVSRLTHQYSEVCRTEANLDDLGLAFRHMNIDIQELAEYVKNVESVPCVIGVPKFPISKENHLNFLKPGSREVVTRPVHVHEHLPAMYPDTEEELNLDKTENLPNGVSDVGSCNGASSNEPATDSPQRISPQAVFKRPGDPVSFENTAVKRAKLLEEGRPLREIHSVMMTTSGFLSPAREGKLPEARTPHQTRSDSPQPTSYPMVPPELKSDKKPKKLLKKITDDRKLDKENKKKNRVKDLFKPDKIDDSKVKKLAGMKELAKLKPLKPGGGKTQCNTAGPSSRPPTPKLTSQKTLGSPKLPRNTQIKGKSEKVVDLTSSPPQSERKEENIDKLPSEPDKQKLNIFKKISKPREDKEKEIIDQHKHKELDSRESSPSLVIDENDKHAYRNDLDSKRDEKKVPHTPNVHISSDAELVDIQSPSSDVYMFDDMSPPGTPSTPKTPELNVPTPTEQKKRKRDKTTKRKEPKIKSPKHCVSPKKTKMTNDTMELDILDRPKTPQAIEPPVHREPNIPPNLPFPFFPPFPAAPGLIPHPITHPIFSRFPLPIGRGGPGPHPAMPNLPIPPRFLNSNQKPDDFSLSRSKPLEHERSTSTSLNVILPSMKSEKLEKDRNDKIGKVNKLEKDIYAQTSGNLISQSVTSSPSTQIVQCTPVAVTSLMSTKVSKSDKIDKIDKKSKEHKKEKKDKIKKKKDKKEKHKDKGEKLKDKKDKLEKREKLDKIKEKKEKKDKRKDKELNKKNTKEDKGAEAVPKITLKLPPSSPRPQTPDNTIMKKITIKPVFKNPEEDIKREPSPELAKISALVTRPPKQKPASKKTEEGGLDSSLSFPADSFSTNFSSVPISTTPRPKKSIFKALPHRSPSPPLHMYTSVPKSLPVVQQQPPYYFVKADGFPKKANTKEDKENGKMKVATSPATTLDEDGRQVWICPACNKPDDGSPMIGCDDCDAWYHWVCVGMQVAPAEDDNWYCRFCIAKKQEQHDKKKKKRKKKVKLTA